MTHCPNIFFLVVFSTLFFLHHENDILLVQVYVDEIIFGSTNDDLRNHFAKIMTDQYEMSHMDKLKFFLGLQFTQTSDGIYINQEAYCKRLLKKYHMDCISTMKPQCQLLLGLMLI